MQFTFFSFVMSLLWFNLYIVIINAFRKRDNFITSFSTLPLIFFLFLSIFRLIFNFEIPGAVIIKSKNIFPEMFDIIRKPLDFNGFSIKTFQVIVFIWISITVILLVNIIVKYSKFKKSLEKLNDNSSDKNKKIFNQIIKQTKTENKINIVQNDNISSPFILGISKGKIYVPNNDFSKEELEYIILHEINHFLGKDSLKKILIQGIKYLFWWNPFAHLFANNFNHILEIQCDLKTTAGFSKEEKIEYLESITKIIKSGIDGSIQNMSHSSVARFVGIEELNSLKQRFRIILNYKAKPSLFKLLTIGLCALALLLNGLSYFVIIQPYYRADIETGLLTADELNLQEEDSFIIKNKEGKYELYRNNVFQHIIDDINKEEFKGIPIY